MSEPGKWRDGVRIVRGQSLDALIRTPGSGRATIFDFAGTGGEKTWIGAVTVPPKSATGLHHHGRHEVMIYVVRGRSQIRWGDRLEFAAEIGPGDFAYFTPYVPHQEANLDEREPVEFVAVRSDNERIAIKLDGAIVEQPETVA
jgi:uncharacterized RmlC-like cupin family protein